jgi:hypothetical protein
MRDMFAAMDSVLRTHPEVGEYNHRESGVSSTPRLLGSITGVSGILDHPPEPVIGRRVAPTRWRVMTTILVREIDRLSYAAGTGSAVTDLIFSIAKREVTFFSETALISFL